MKNIYITNKDKTKILTIDSEGNFEFLDINEELFLEKSSLFVFTEETRNIRRVCRDYNHNILFDSTVKEKINTTEISYHELLNILIRNT